MKVRTREQDSNVRLLQMRFESRQVNVGGINTHYLVGGEGPPLILIHGAGAVADRNDWGPNLDAMASGHKVYAPDLVGYGTTDKPKVDYTMSYFYAFFTEFVTALGLERMSLMGHSLGGSIAISYALNHPLNVEKLVLVASAGLSNNIGPVGKVLLPIFKMIARFKKDNTYLSLVTSGDEPEVFMDRLHEIEVPTLLVWGEWDGYIPARLARKAHRKLPNSQLHIFKRVWHSPHRQRAEEFNRLVLAFLDGNSEK